MSALDLDLYLAGLTGQAASVQDGLDTREIERDWRTWLKAVAPRTFTGSWASFHVEFWDWFWQLIRRRKAGESITKDEQAFLAVWARGQGKSSNVEWAAIMEGALIGTGYVLYVSGTQVLAEGHVQAIRERLESEEVSRYYPHLGAPKVGKHGNQYGWRQNFLITSGGWAIRPIGLDVGVRGGRVGDIRPSLIVGDDIDDHTDSPHVVQKKLDTLARSIIPAGTRETIFLGAQNLIHRHSVFNQIVQNKTSVLSRRIISGPHPAFKDLELEFRQTPKGPRYFIVGGTPTWDDMDLAACQKFLDDSGRESFLAEYQHDFSAIEQGRVVPEYDDDLHVISWSEFERVYKARYIPQNWQREVGHDVGFTEGHISAFSFVATSSANSDAAGKRFLYRGMTFVKPLVDDMAAEVERVMGPDEATKRTFDEKPLIQRWRMSHEAKSERDTYNVKFDMPFYQCKSGKQDGISQLRHFLRPDKTQPHPFKRDELQADGTYRLGCPGFFFIVDDDQVKEPRDDAGLILHRRQLRDWRWKVTPLTEAGMKKDEPVKYDEDTVDSLRMITAEWGPDITPHTADEHREASLPKGLAREQVERLRGWDLDMAQLMRTYELKQLDKQQKPVHWSTDVLDAKDEEWI